MPFLSRDLQDIPPTHNPRILPRNMRRTPECSSDVAFLYCGVQIAASFGQSILQIPTPSSDGIRLGAALDVLNKLLLWSRHFFQSHFQEIF